MSTFHNDFSQEIMDIDSNMDDGIIKFPEKIARLPKCAHRRIRIDSKALEVICLSCNAKVNAVQWIISNSKYFIDLQNTVNEKRKKIDDDLNDLKKRSRTRCVHCQKMTSISLKHHFFKIVE